MEEGSFYITVNDVKGEVIKLERLTYGEFVPYFGISKKSTIELSGKRQYYMNLE